MTDIPIEFYELKKVLIEPLKPGEFRLSTAAVMSCSLCDRTITGMGGPGSGEICTECGEHLMAGRLKGAVKYEDESINLTCTPEQPEYDDGELWGGDPNCKHTTICMPGGGVKCTKCSGWCCY